MLLMTVTEYHNYEEKELINLEKTKSIYPIFLYGIALYGATIIGKVKQTNILPLMIIFISTMLWFFVLRNSFINKTFCSYILYGIVSLIFSLLFCWSYLTFSLFEVSIAYIVLFVIEIIIARIFISV